MLRCADLFFLFHLNTFHQDELLPAVMRRTTFDVFLILHLCCIVALKEYMSFKLKQVSLTV